MPNPPRFTAASWLLPALIALVTWALVAYATAHRSGGDWFPGLLQFVIGTGLAALSAFGCGLTAILRRERLRWLALPPFLAGLGAILYFCSNIVRNSFH